MKHSLSRQLIRKVLWLSLLGFIGLGGVFALSLIITLQEVQKRLEWSGLRAVHNFDRLVLDIESDLLATSHSLSSSSDFEHLLQQMRSRNRYLLQARLLDHNGQTLQSIGRMESQPLTLPEDVKSTLKSKIDQTYVSLNTLQGKGPYVEMAAGFTNELGISQGVLMIQVDLTELENQIIRQKVGQSGYVYILNSDRQIVATNQLHWLGESLPSPQHGLGANNFHLRTGLNHQLVFAVARPLEQVPWSVIVEQPVLEAIQPALGPTALITLALALGFKVIVNILSFSRREIVDPLQKLSLGVEEFKAGRLPQLEAVDAKNELGQLTTAFQSMAVQLQNSFEILELRVQERTSQLASINHKLAREVIQHQATAKSLAASEMQFRKTIQLAPIGMALTSLDGEFLTINKALCELLESSEEQLIQRSWADVLDPRNLEVVTTSIQELLMGRHKSRQCEVSCQSSNREPLHLVLNFVLIGIPDCKDQDSHLIIQIVDITDRKKAEDQLAYAAMHDHLTGLANRSFLVELIDDELKKVHQCHDYTFSVLFLDLDRFKMVNDSLGHNMGDELLIQVAQQLNQSLCKKDTVARMGGDEFAILLTDIRDRSEVAELVKCILHALESPFQLGTYRVNIGASIGIAFSNPCYSSAKDILRDADIAMYKTKKAKTGEYEIFHEGMYQQALQRLSLESKVRQALENEDFILHYQPILSLETLTVSGFEALVRWKQSDGTLVPPNKFIPAAEESGLIIELGNWVLEQACRDLIRWRSHIPSFNDIEVNVNLSGNQLQHPEFLQTVDSILNTYNVVHQLKLELTETMLMDSNVISILNQLKQRGLKLSIDDFGTGYSSLRYLQNFPVDSLKIDRSFITKMGQTRSDMEVVHAIISLAHTFDLSVVAEGIENPEQIRQLVQLGCQFGQGFLFSKPIPASQIESRQFEFIPQVS